MHYAGGCYTLNLVNPSNLSHEMHIPVVYTTEIFRYRLEGTGQPFRVSASS